MPAHRDRKSLTREVVRELRPTLALAAPIALAELGWMAMGVVDTVMVGRLGPEAIGAVGLGSSLHIAIVVFGMGLLLGMDAVVARSFGKGDLAECHRTLIQGLYLSLATTPIFMGLVLLVQAALPHAGIEPEVIVLVGPFLTALNWSTPPLMVYSAFRRYILGMGQTRAIVLSLVLANAINLLGNYALIHGHFGLPALGVTGSGWSTFLARVTMAVVMVVHAFRADRKQGGGLWRISLRPDWERLRHLLKLGIPAAIHVSLEVGVFATVTALAGRFTAVALAAHQLVLESASVTFMVPFGVSSAAAVRVGHALGRHEPREAVAAGWAALLVGEGFMLMSGLAFLLIPRTILGFYTDDPATIASGVTLFAIAACFQLFDGMQVVGAGVLRGAGDTHTTMYINLVAYWVIGLPVGATLAFGLGQRVPGLWVGLSAGLMVAGVFLLAAWARRTRQLEADPGGTRGPR
jgi:MATE family multidrug resistance protein